ncbi:hypothetical protein [Thiolapillus sp.]
MKPSTTVDEVLFALVLTGFGSRDAAAERTGKYSQRPVNGKVNNTGHLDEEQP